MRFIDNEVPSGTINGTNTVFTLQYSPDPAAPLVLVLNGVQQLQSVDYTLSGNTVTFTSAPQSGDWIRAWYRAGGTELAGSGGMLRDDAIQVIHDRLGLRTNLTTQIVRQMQAVQSRLEEGPTLPWFLTREYEWTSSSQSNLLPTAFIRELDDEGSLWIVESDGRLTRLLKEHHDFLLDSDSLAGTGKPSHYALVSDSLKLFKAPDTSYTFRLYYYQYDEILASNIKNGWLAYASDLIISETCFEMARVLRDVQAMQLFAGDRQAARDRLIRQNVARQFAGVEYSIG